MRRTSNTGHSKKTSSIFFRKIVLDDEIPNDDLIKAIREGEEYLKSGNIKYYETVEEIMAAHDEYARTHKK